MLTFDQHPRQARSRAQFPPSRFLPPRDFDYLAQARLALATARTITRVEQFALHSIQLGLVQALTRALAAPFLTARNRAASARSDIRELFIASMVRSPRRANEQSGSEPPSRMPNTRPRGLLASDKLGLANLCAHRRQLATEQSSAHISGYAFSGCVGSRLVYSQSGALNRLCVCSSRSGPGIREIGRQSLGFWYSLIQIWPGRGYRAGCRGRVCPASQPR